MIQTKALVINEKTYPIAVALLKGGFLTVPEEETYGCVVVINQIVGQYDKPVSGPGAARRVRYGAQGRLSYPGRRIGEDRSITFENVWYDEETFNAEWAMLDEQEPTGSFWNVKRKPEPDYSAYDQDEIVDEHPGGSCDNPSCCHLDT